MSRWIPVLVCVLLSPAARADWGHEIPYANWLRAWYVNWDGTVSRTQIRIANLPITEALGRPDLTLRLGFPWFAPMCVNWDRFPWPRRRPARLPHRPLIIRKPIDGASPVLQNADRTKRTLRRVVIRSRDPSGSGLKIVLRDVRVGCITTFSSSMVPGTDYEDFIALDYGAVRVSRLPASR